MARSEILTELSYDKMECFVAVLNSFITFSKFYETIPSFCAAYEIPSFCAAYEITSFCAHMK